MPLTEALEVSCSADSGRGDGKSELKAVSVKESQAHKILKGVMWSPLKSSTRHQILRRLARNKFRVSAVEEVDKALLLCGLGLGKIVGGAKKGVSGGSKRKLRSQLKKLEKKRAKDAERKKADRAKKRKSSSAGAQTAEGSLASKQSESSDASESSKGSASSESSSAAERKRSSRARKRQNEDSAQGNARNQRRKRANVRMSEAAGRGSNCQD